MRNIRHAYLRSALSQEVAFYDIGSGGSIATQATSNGRLIQAGIAEKLGLGFQGVSAFVTAFIVAFVVQWKLTLICLCIAPAVIIVTGGVAAFEAKNETRILEIYAQSNSIAEGVLSSIRTVQAFEMRARLVRKFDEYLMDAHKVGKKNGPLFGALFSAEYTIIYLGFGLAFWQGIRMLARGEIDDPGTIFTYMTQSPPVCDVPNVVFLVFYCRLSSRPSVSRPSHPTRLTSLGLVPLPRSFSN